MLSHGHSTSRFFMRKELNVDQSPFKFPLLDIRGILINGKLLLVAETNIYWLEIIKWNLQLEILNCNLSLLDQCFAKLGAQKILLRRLFHIYC